MWRCGAEKIPKGRTVLCKGTGLPRSTVELAGLAEKAYRPVKNTITPTQEDDVLHG